MDHLQLESLTKISEGLPVFPVHLRVSKKRKEKKRKKEPETCLEKQKLTVFSIVSGDQEVKTSSSSYHPFRESTPQEEEKGSPMEQPEFLQKSKISKDKKKKIYINS